MAQEHIQPWQFQKGNEFGKLTQTHTGRKPNLKREESREVNDNWGQTILNYSRLLRSVSGNLEILKMYMMPAGMEKQIDTAVKVLTSYMPKPAPDVQINIQNNNNQNTLTLNSLTQVVKLVQENESKLPLKNSDSSLTQQSIVPSTAANLAHGGTQPSKLTSCVRVESSEKI